MTAHTEKSYAENPMRSARESREGGRFGWASPLVALALPSAAAFAISAGLTATLSRSGVSGAPALTGEWANVWTLAIYIPAMLAVIWFARREGLRIRDIVGFERSRWVRESLLGLGMMLVFGVALGVAGFAASFAVYGVFGNPAAGGGGSSPAYPDSLVFYAASLVLLPLFAGVFEEIIYRGYAVPRLAALSGRVPAVIIMSLFFGLQHVGIAFSADWRFALMRGVSLFLVGLVLGVVYLKQRRLGPLIIGHVLIDVLGLGLPVVLFS